MAKTGRENYNRAIEFRSPDHLPILVDCNFNWLHEKDEAKIEKILELMRQVPDEIVGPFETPVDVPEPVEENGVRRWLDQWGTGWEDDGHGPKTEGYPLEQGYELMAGHPFPDAHHPARFETADKMIADADDEYIRGTVWFTLFERLWMLRGFDNMLMDPYVEFDNFCALRDRILDYNLGMIDEWIKRDVDAVFFSDDWGCQRGLLVSPDDWRKYYRPSYEAMFSRVRDGAAHVWMHLCGDISAILGDLVDIGLNVLNPVQPQAMDAHHLSREFGGKVCFNGGIDVQGTLIHGSQDDVRREVHELVDLFGRFDGGYIAGTSHTVMPETPLDNVHAMYGALLEYV